jgi:erythromycin esterase-like protein
VDAALAQWEEVQQRAADSREMTLAEWEELFSALQNARILKNAEAFYRSMYNRLSSSWNLRDQHMTESLEALSAHLAVDGERARVVVWAHNSHVGDARATQMGRSGQWNIGQLVRERYPDETVLVGFTTYSGTVMAASSWGEAGAVYEVNPSLPESYGALFHDVGIDDFMLLFQRDHAPSRSLEESRLVRAIGVIYRPQSERQSHYFEAELSKQFDAVIHLDRTRAVEPLAADE